MIIVTASARKIGFGTLDPYFGLRLWTQTSDLVLQASDSGLSIYPCGSQWAVGYATVNTTGCPKKRPDV